MYSDVKLTPEQVARILGRPQYEEDQAFSNFKNSKDPLHSELSSLCHLLTSKLEKAVNFGMKGAPGYIEYPECPLRRQNICGPTADVLGILLMNAGIETEVVTVELPHNGLYAAPTHTFLKTVGDNPYLIDPSYIQFINGFEEFRGISKLPDIAVFPINDTDNQVTILTKQIAAYNQNLLKIKRLDPSYPVVRAIPLNAQEIKEYLSGIWNIASEGTKISDSKHLSEIQNNFNRGNLSQIPPLRAKLLAAIFSAA